MSWRATACLVLLSSALLAQVNPVPLVSQPLVPASVAPGSADFTLTVNGTGFVAGSVVNWNGSALATTFVNSHQLTANVPGTDVAASNTGWVTVTSPGGKTSNPVFFPVSFPVSSPTFTRTDIPAGSGRKNAITADFNGDGKLDLAVANAGSDTVSIFLGNGDGTFQSSSDYATGPSPYSVVAGDFNGDGKLDLAIADSSCQGSGYCDTATSGAVSVLLGNGDGTFQPKTDYPTLIAPVSIVAADFDQNGALDVAVAQFSTTDAASLVPSGIDVLLGRGDGTLQSATSYATHGIASAVGAGDFNQDGLLDLGAANFFDGLVSIFKGGGGLFSLTFNYDTGVAPDAVVAADFNGDGKLDLAVANENPGAQGSVSLFAGNGDGTFQNDVEYSTGSGPHTLDLGDLNNDGHLDLAAADILGSEISILLGNGDGTFQNPQFVTTDVMPDAVVVGDFNGDGLLDLAAPTEVNNTVSVLLQTGIPTAVLSSGNLKFAVQVVGTTSRAQSVTLTNTGTAALQIASIVASGDFVQSNTCGSGIVPGATCTISVTFTPTRKGSRNGSVTITDNAVPGIQTVTLTGTGTVVSLSTNRLNFPPTKVGQTSSPLKVKLTNVGITALSLTGITVTGTNSGDFSQTNRCGTHIAAGGSCTISVTFAPLATGSRSATLNISDNGGGSPQKVTLVGTGT